MLYGAPRCSNPYRGFNLSLSLLTYTSKKHGEWKIDKAKDLYCPEDSNHQLMPGQS